MRRLLAGTAALASIVYFTACHDSSASRIMADAAQRDSGLLSRIAPANSDACAWLLRNVRPDGSLPYLTGAMTMAGQSDEDNEVRQLMSTRLLAALASEDTSYLAAHRRNLNHVMQTLYRKSTSGVGYMLFRRRSKLGANAMAHRELLASPDFERYRRESHSLARGIIGLLDPTGRFSPLFISAPGTPPDSVAMLRYYSGQAILALAEYEARTGAAAARAAMFLAASHYLNEYAGDIEVHYHPAYVPWLSLAFRQLYLRTGNTTYARAIGTLNDRLLEIQDTVDVVGRFYSSQRPDFGDPHASSGGIYTEGLAAAYDVARRTGDLPRAASYRRALVRAVANLTRLQFRATTHHGRAYPRDVRGSFRSRVGSHVARLDNTQHAIDAFRLIQRVW